MVAPLKLGGCSLKLNQKDPTQTNSTLSMNPSDILTLPVSLSRKLMLANAHISHESQAASFLNPIEMGFSELQLYEQTRRR